MEEETKMNDLGRRNENEWNGKNRLKKKIVKTGSL
jgi:hypothetical protein